jgi:hypothetical protein
MAALSTQLPTMLDLAKMLDPDGKTLAQIVPILNQDNEILPRLRWQESNGTWSHRTTYHTSLPTPTWSKINGSIAPAKGTTGQSTDGMGEMQGYSQVDPILADASGNVNAFRLRHDAMHMQGMSHEFAQTLFYGNADLVPEEFTGLSARYPAGGSSALRTETAENILDGGSNDTDNTSIWIVCMDSDMPGVTGIYRPGSQAGLKMTNKGLQTVSVGSGGEFAERYVTHYRWSCGIAVPDWRKNVRIANIEVSDLTKNAATGADLLDLIMQGLELLPSGSQSSAVILGNRTVSSFLRRQSRNAIASSTLGYETVAGKPVLTVGGTPFLRCDALTNAESAVPFS